MPFRWHGRGLFLHMFLLSSLACTPPLPPSWSGAYFVWVRWPTHLLGPIYTLRGVVPVKVFLLTMKKIILGWCCRLGLCSCYRERLDYLYLVSLVTQFKILATIHGAIYNNILCELSPIIWAHGAYATFCFFTQNGLAVPLRTLALLKRCRSVKRKKLTGDCYVFDPLKRCHTRLWQRRLEQSIIG